MQVIYEILATKQRVFKMSAEEIMRQRLREYQQLLEMSYTFIKKLKLAQEQQEIAEHLMKAMRANGIGDREPRSGAVK